MCSECECILFSINYTRTSNRVGLLHSDGETEHQGLRPDCAGFLWRGLTTMLIFGNENQRNCGSAMRPPFKNHRREGDLS